MAISFTPTKIARFVGALYGVALNNNTNTEAMKEIYARGFDAVANDVFASDFGTKTTAQVAQTVANNLGLTGATNADAVVYLEGQLNAAAPAARGAVISSTMNLFASLVSDAQYGAAATAFEARVANAIVYSNTSSSVYHGSFADLATGVAFNLSTGFDNFTGTSGNDTFSALIFDNQNTLQSGDTINGGAGIDTLYADIGSSQSFSITPTTTSVEVAKFRAQSNASDGAQNNPQGQAGAHIDAQRMSGVTWLESNNSRADLIIEDVRTNSNLTTIAFVESDPGNVDLAVYFNQRNLVNTTSSSSSLKLQVMDTVAAAAGAAPLRDSTYGAFTFTSTNNDTHVSTVLTLTSQAIQDAQTYAQLVTAFQNALDAQFGAGAATATLGDSFSVVDPASGISCTGQSVVLTASGSLTFTTPTGSGWSSSGIAPAASNFYTNWTTGGSGSIALVNTDIVLDDVGMGSMGGDLVVGGMSTGLTSGSKGVERFNIEVRDNSQLQTISSTNNTLREVVIHNGDTSSSSTAYVTTTTNAGMLTVTGTVLSPLVSDTAMTGATSGAAAAGFTDVRLIDASAMTGQFNFTAAVTEASIAKYVNRVDINASPTADVATNNTTDLGANFVYSGGTNSNTMSVTIDSGVSASRSHITSGQSDFTFAINGGASADSITVRMVDSGLAGSLENWANNQDLNNNITINAGAGNDTIMTPGAGDMIIDAGAGNDTVYTDNTGRQTVADLLGAVGITTAGTTTSNGVWVFNTYDQVNAVANGAARNLTDLRSDANDSYNFYKGTVTVTFKGVPSATITLANATTYKTTDLEINQAIKNAINTDATLSKLLVAQDGPGNTLVVTSLIDGVMSTADLAVTFAAPAATTVYTAAEYSGMATAYGNPGITSSALALAAQVLPSSKAAQNDYATAMAQDSTGLNIVGAASTSTSDNFVSPGTGNDVIVLGTTVGVDAARSSNEVVTLAAGFGNDVIVNFASSGFGADHLNVGAFLTTPSATSVGALANTDNLVTVVAEAATTNDTLALVTAIIKAAVDTAVQATATKQVYIVYNAHNVGSVYSVVNGTAASDAVVTLEGTIDLASTAWSTMNTASLFKTTGAQTEGASSAAIAATLNAVINSQVLVGTTGLDTFNTNAFTGVTMTGLAGADVFNIAAAGAIITDLATGDAIVHTAGAVTAGATNALGVSSFVATAATTTNAAAANVIINGLDAGSTINMALAGVTAAATDGYRLNGGTGNDTLTGSVGADILTSGATGTDTLNGGAGNDTMSSGGGTVTFNGGTGANGITGGAGVDTVNTVSGGVDTVGTFAGTDVITVASGGAANVTTSAIWSATAASSNNGVLNIDGSAAAGVYSMALMGGSHGVGFTSTNVGADTITGTALADVITLSGGGADTITGGLGSDIISIAGAGNYTFVFTSSATADYITNTGSVWATGGADKINISMAGIAIGNADTTADGAMTHATTLTAGVDLGVITGNTTSLFTLNDTSAVAAAKAVTAAGLVGWSAPEAIGHTAIIAFDDGTNSAIFKFVSADVGVTITADELTLIGIITNATTANGDFAFVA